MSSSGLPIGRQVRGNDNWKLVYIGDIGNYAVRRLRPGGGIGRHAGLKILCPQRREGSTPSLATNLRFFRSYGWLRYSR